MIDQVHPRDLAQWLEAASAHGQPLLLDVREPWEVNTASAQVPGYDFAAIPMHTIPARINELDPDRPVACLCHHGGRSMQVAMFLSQRGFERVANVTGGIDLWARDCDTTIPRY